MGLLKMGIDALGASSANKKQAKLINKNTALSRAEFDKRDAVVQDSDRWMSEIARQEAERAGTNSDETFAYLLGQNRSGFDEQQGLTRKALETQSGAFGGLVTASRAARLRQIEASNAERDRQLAFQGQADDLAAVLPGNIGFDAQQTGRADSMALRGALITAATGAGPATPSFGGDDARLSGAYAGAAEGGRSEGIGDSLRSANLSSYQDAFKGSEADLARFGTDIGQLTTKAAISRSALPAELQEGAIARRIAEDGYKGTVDYANTERDLTSDSLSRFRGANTQSRSDYSSGLQDALNNYFGRSYDTRGALTDKVLGASTTYEDRVTGANNQRINNTKPSPWLRALSGIVSDAEKAVGAAVGKGG